MLENLIDDFMVQKDDRIAVGVSGGVDSMLLLWALIFKQKQVGFYLKVLNVNHHLRGEESDRDSEFVKKFCEKKGIDCKILDIDVKSHKIISKKSMEQSARDLRFDAINAQMKKDKLNKLFLAHHKNDQAETILMHILRGSGLAGACGMKLQASNVYRPLLKFSKIEILQMAKDYGIEFVEDSTNHDIQITRNYIRNVVVPAMEKMYPNAVDAIAEFGKKCEEVQTYAMSMIDKNLLECNKFSCVIQEPVKKNPKFLIREYIKLAFENVGVFSDIEAKHYDLVMSLFEKPVNSCLDLPHGVQAIRTYAGVKLLKKVAKKVHTNEYEFVIGSIKFDGFGEIKTEIVDADEVEYGDGCLYADYSKISNSAVWRVRKLGDSFSKLGTGSKKLNDYFTDKKIDMQTRDTLPVLAVENQILVVAGTDISENVKIDSSTDTIVKIMFVKA